MVRLYEYQGKKLLSNEGIAVPKGEIAKTTVEVSELATKIGQKVVLKPQILSGRRGKAGAIKFANDLGAAEKLAEELFGLEIHNFSVKEILVEEFISFKKEFYMSTLSYHATRKPLCIVSSVGGVEIEEISQAHPECITKRSVNIRKGLREYEARNLIRKLPGVSSSEVSLLGDILKRLYDVYRHYDCKLAEINPLVITEDGKAIALDARIEIDDDALVRHPELGLKIVEDAGRPETELEVIAGKLSLEDPRGIIHYIQSDPDGSYSKESKKVPIGFYSTGTGSTLTATDELAELGYMAANTTDTSLVPASKIYKLMKIILSQPHIQGFVFVSPHSSQQLSLYARGMIKALKELYPETGGKPNVPMIFCLRGGWDEEARGLFEKHGMDKGRWVRILGRVTEADVAKEFHRLYQEWKKNVK